MKIIGLTGGIGSGKSAVARFLAELGAEVINLDTVGHDVLYKAGNAYKKAVWEFGKGILNKDGEIDRSKLGALVFSAPTALKRLNDIVHPEIDIAVAKKVNEFRRRGVKVLVLEAAVMQEAAKTSQADEIWVTIAPESTILGRLKERPGFSDKDIKARIQSQMKNEERMKKADVVINNDGSLDELKAIVIVEWEKLLKRL
jgi:dephospho-CoA kinase